MAVRRKPIPTATPSEPVSVLSSTEDVNKIVQDTFGINKGVANDLSISSDEKKSKPQAVVPPPLIKDPLFRQYDTKKQPQTEVKFHENGSTTKGTFGENKEKVIGLKDVRTLFGNRKLLVEKGKTYYVDKDFAEFLYKIEAVK
jgi:hypothetical protein